MVVTNCVLGMVLNESVSACIHDFVEVWVNGNEANNETLMDKQFWSSNLCLRKDAIKKFRNFQVNKNVHMIHTGPHICSSACGSTAKLSQMSLSVASFIRFKIKAYHKCCICYFCIFRGTAETLLIACIFCQGI